MGPLAGGQLADPSLVSWFGYATPFWAAAILLAAILGLSGDLAAWPAAFFPLH